MKGIIYQPCNRQYHTSQLDDVLQILPVAPWVQYLLGLLDLLIGVVSGALGAVRNMSTKTASSLYEERLVQRLKDHPADLDRDLETNRMALSQLSLEWRRSHMMTFNRNTPGMGTDRELSIRPGNSGTRDVNQSDSPLRPIPRPDPSAELPGPEASRAKVGLVRPSMGSQTKERVVIINQVPHPGDNIAIDGFDYEAFRLRCYTTQRRLDEDWMSFTQSQAGER